MNKAMNFELNVIKMKIETSKIMFRHFFRTIKLKVFSKSQNSLGINLRLMNSYKGFVPHHITPIIKNL